MGRMGRHIGLRLAMAAVLLVAAAYGASRAGLFVWPRHYDPLALPDLAETPHWLTGTQFKLVDLNVDNCLAALAGVQVPAARQPSRVQNHSCTRDGTIILSRLSSARLRAEETRCAIAARLYMWERHVLQPAAQQMLGEGITEIQHFGSFSCRPMRGSSSMSEHATANAFDISGFKTTSGRNISLKHDWGASTPKGRFLTFAREGLCDWFNVTLSPDYNADHADHFHVDMGWYRSCR